MPSPQVLEEYSQSPISPQLGQLQRAGLGQNRLRLRLEVRLRQLTAG
jgi:hypothetical protein